MSIFTKSGISLPLLKEPAASRPIEEMENVTRVTLPLSFSGESSPRRPALGSYSTVIRGQVIGLPEDEQDTPVLASVTGVLSGTQTLIHPLYGELE